MHKTGSTWAKAPLRVMAMLAAEEGGSSSVREQVGCTHDRNNGGLVLCMVPYWHYAGLLPNLVITFFS